MRNAEVIRQWRILKRIEAGRFTSTQDLAKEHQVTDRTVRRDIEALQEAGFPLYDEIVNNRKVWRLIEGYRQRVTQSFSLAELAALYFGRNLMAFLAGAPFEQELESAFEKIREALPPKSLPYLSRIQSLFVTRADARKDYSRKRAVVAALIDATLHQRCAVLQYFSFSSRRRKRYTVEPYRVVYYHGGLYLYARVQEYAEVRTFAVERIEQIEVLEAEFEMPADYDASEHNRGGFGIAGGAPETVELRFDRELAGYVRERLWHESQEIEDLPDGGVRLRLSVAPNRELRAWLKGFLPHVRVLRPASLREKLVDEVSAGLKRLQRAADASDG
jgi:predicted DNA-binding transcriptional regulator YafY